MEAAWLKWQGPCQVGCTSLFGESSACGKKGVFAVLIPLTQQVELLTALHDDAAENACLRGVMSLSSYVHVWMNLNGSHRILSALTIHG